MKGLSWLIALVGWSAVLWAQSTAQINGTIKDQTGAVLPGVEVTATQTTTGFTRSAVTDETGSYALTTLPVGPYRLEAALPGFRSFVQTGIVLQVGSNPVINVSLQIGQVSEQVEVQADAALVETRSTGVGQVIDNVRVLELPLNGRQVTDLIILSGAAVGGGNQGTARTWPTDFISVGGGLNDGLTFLLDGGTHNDPFSNANLPLPFPDALQEFKVETSAVPAQYGQHSSGAVNSVTKSGSNEFHGDLFEFVRNKIFNARNAFSPTRDGLKRNQFGGVAGGPIIKNKLFFFGGHQATIQRSEANVIVSYVPTPQMLSGDWTGITSPACSSKGQIGLKGPFVNNRIDPALFSKAALTLVTKYLPKPIDECGQTVYGRRQNSDEHMTVGKVDYQASQKHSMFGRYERGSLFTPNNYNGSNVLSLSIPDYARRFHSFVLGDTYSLSPKTVSSFRGTVLRTVNDKSLEQDFYSYGDLGVKNLYYPPGWKHFVRLMVSGAFTQDVSAPGVTNSTVEQFTEDLSMIHGAHQIGFGANYIHSNMNYTSGTWTAGRFSFTSNTTGLSLGDLMIGRPNEWRQDQIASQYLRQNYVGLYLQDTWKATSKFTLNGGLRWEPFFWPYDHRAASAQYNKKWFDQGLRSTVYPNAPAGILFPGDPGAADIGNSEHAPAWKHFAPRAGLAWDPKGNGMTVVRAAYGLFFDYPHFQGIGGIRNTPPRGGLIQLTNPVGGFDDPWQGYAGGNPIPLAISKDVVFPTLGTYTVIPQDTKTSYVNQWNLSIQKQVGMDWLVSGNYIGSSVIHQLYEHEANPAVYFFNGTNTCTLSNGQTISGPPSNPNDPTSGHQCSTTTNTNLRRVLSVQNPAQGQYFSNIVEVDSGGTRSYNGLVLSVLRRRSRGVTVQGNYTWSHCIDTGYTDIIQTNGVAVPDRRGANRGNCELDRRHNFNMSTVYETPQFANSMLRVLGTGWRVSGIVRMLSGPQMSISTGLDQALTSTVFQSTNTQSDQRPNQVLPSPYLPNKSIANGWLNPAAFVQPAVGTYGTMGRSNVTGPGSVRIDMGLVRIFRLREKQSVEFRAEAFNVANHVNGCSSISGQQGAPDCMNTNLSDATFGRILSAADPRIMQMALKFVF
ncbi:MAG TPA: carboxypeptidase regulatory-like domain-containing protein [Terriglobia bacterium]|nr:carboxypeptidase regulatory-like domain-containing protein [Terriglobia bacterium]